MRRSGSVLLFAVISLGLHLAWVVWMPAGERVVRPDVPWVEVSFEEAAAPEPAASAEPRVAEPSSGATAAVVTEAPARPGRVVRRTSLSTPRSTSTITLPPPARDSAA